MQQAGSQSYGCSSAFKVMTLYKLGSFGHVVAQQYTRSRFRKSRSRSKTFLRSVADCVTVTPVKSQVTAVSVPSRRVAR